MYRLSCGVCGKYFFLSYLTKKWYYCPNCGNEVKGVNK
ncbi:unknown [Lactococcus phage Q54]|uniref:Uncharacterized protein n=1 Tax=Lactococcus phage Q54 TaxID=382685 RepID=Q0GXT5_9CAUD|nr:hypothetical protein Q54_gp37 [Lactococcus phage Q54]ABF22591.1 unknown [Lactococcus phage Q54]